MKRGTVTSLLFVLLFVSLGSTFQYAFPTNIPYHSGCQTSKPVYSVGDELVVEWTSIQIDSSASYTLILYNTKTGNTAQVPLYASDMNQGMVRVRTFDPVDEGNWTARIEMSSSSSSFSLDCGTFQVVSGFDFSLRVEGICPDCHWVTGDEVHIYVYVTLEKGSPSPVSLQLDSSSQLPALAPGDSPYFEFPTVMPTSYPGTKAILEMQTSSIYTSPGTYSIIIDGTGAGVSHNTDSITLQLKTMNVPPGVSINVDSQSWSQLIRGKKVYDLPPGRSQRQWQAGDTIRAGTQDIHISGMEGQQYGDITLGPGSYLYTDAQTQDSMTSTIGGTYSQSVRSDIVALRSCDPISGRCVIHISSSYADCQCYKIGTGPCADDPTFTITATNTTMSLRTYRGSVTLVDENTHQTLTVNAGYETSATIGSAPMTPTPINDNTPLAVASAYPSSAQNQISASTPISVTFNKLVYPRSTAGSNFTLTTSTGTPIGGDWIVFGATVVYWPQQNLPPGTYAVTVRGGSRGVEDLSGDTLPSDYGFTFTIGAEAQTTLAAPSLLSPANTYQPAIDPASVTFTWNNNGGSGLVFAVYVDRYDYGSNSWVSYYQPSSYVQATSFTLTNLQSGSSYAWIVVAVDPTQRNNPWYAWSNWYVFSTN